MNYKIAVDGACDIDDKYLNRDDFCVLAMDYSINDEYFVYDGIQNEDNLIKLYENQKNGDLTKTSQITPYLYEEHFKQILNDYDGLLYLSLSSGLSATYQSALLAKKNVLKEYPDKKIEIFDSLSASCGIGLMAQKAINNKDNNLSIEDNYNDLLSYRDSVNHFFVVDDLMYLKKGGRISSTSAIIGSAIGIKPILTIDSEGKLETIEKKKGSVASANYIIDMFLKDVDTSDTVCIVDSNNPKMKEYVVNKIKESLGDVLICEKKLSPIIGAHTGPGLIAIIYKTK